MSEKPMAKVHKILLRRETFSDYPAGHQALRFLGIRSEAKALAELERVPRDPKRRMGYRVFNGDACFYIFENEAERIS